MSTALAVTAPPAPELDSDAGRMLEVATAFQITTPMQYQEGMALLKEVKALHKKIEAHHRPTLDAINAAKNTAMDAMKAHTVPLERAEEILKQRGGAFLEAEEKREQEQARLALAKAQAEAEAQRKAELKALREAGAKDEAKALKAAPIVSAPIAVPAPAAKIKGVAVKKTFTYTITDASKIDRRFMTPDEVKIGNLVRSMGLEAAALVGGIEVHEKKIHAVGAR